MLRVTVLICVLLPVLVQAQGNDLRQWVLVTTPEALSSSDTRLGDLEVLQDGRLPKEGRPLIQRRVPFHIGFVLYESGSGRSLPDHSVLLESVLDWNANAVQHSKSDAFLVGFNDSILISTEPTTDTSQLHRALSAVRPFGGSALRDAIIHSAHKFDSVPREPPGARLLVIVTDGHDNASHATEREVIDTLQSSGVRAYVICLPGGGTFKRDFLNRLARDTGGNAFFPSKQDELDRVLAQVERAIDNSFLIGLVPESHDGKAHKLTVRLPKTNADFGYMPVFYSTAVR